MVLPGTHSSYSRFWLPYLATVPFVNYCDSGHLNIKTLKIFHSIVHVCNDTEYELNVLVS